MAARARKSKVKLDDVEDLIVIINPPEAAQFMQAPPKSIGTMQLGSWKISSECWCKITELRVLQRTRRIFAGQCRTAYLFAP